MITFAVTSSPAWAEGICAAAATWPPAIADLTLDDGQGVPSGSDDQLVVDTAVLEPSPAAADLRSALGVPTSPFGVRAAIVGEQPMSAARFGAWARRTAMRAPWPSADVATITAQWLADEVAHDFAINSDVRAAYSARLALRGLVDGHSRSDDMLLAISELTTNAVNHGGGLDALSVSIAGTAIAIEVVDNSPDELPGVLSLQGTGRTGRGLAIVDTIADHWGVTCYRDSKVVWCEFTGLRTQSDD